MKACFARVLTATVQRLPVPHFVVDGALGPDELSEIRAHWPDGASFPEDDIGSGYRLLRFESPATWKLFTPRQRAFWMDFVYGTCLQLVQATFALYAPLIRERYGAKLRVVDLATVSLTEFEDVTVRAGNHVHSDEATWLFTNLIHIDDAGATERGNALYGFSEQVKLNDWDRILPRLMETRPGAGPEEMVPSVKAPFLPGRMFSFYETPLSYHGSEVVRSSSRYGRRQMIRLHARAPAELSQYLYGVSSEEFRASRHSLRQNPQHLAWMKSDIERYHRAPDLRPQADDLRYVGDVEFLGVHGRRRPPLDISVGADTGMFGQFRRALSKIGATAR